VSATPPRQQTLRGPIIAGVCVALMVVLLPLSVLALTDDPGPHLRLLETRGRISALVVDGDARVLIVNSVDREAARAALGELARPWESEPQMLIGPAEDGAAIGLWEALARTQPATVVIVGIPGANPIWSAIEQECQRRAIHLTWVAGTAQVDLPRMTLSMHAPAPEQAGGQYVILARANTRIGLALDGPAPRGVHALVTNRPSERNDADLLVTTNREARRVTQPEIVMGRREVARITLEDARLRVLGGTYRAPETPE
jgi:hypothetical protein